MLSSRLKVLLALIISGFVVLYAAGGGDDSNSTESQDTTTTSSTLLDASTSTSTTESTITTQSTTTTTESATTTDSTTSTSTTQSTTTTIDLSILSSSGKLDGEIKTRLSGLKSEELIPVIIKLRDDSRLKGKLAFSDSAIGSLRERVLARRKILRESYSITQSKVVASLASEAQSSEFKLKRRYALSNSFAASVSQKTLEKLAQNPAVDYIQYDMPVQAFDDESNALINATLAWNFYYLGRNFTGKGQTICIADTGINYNHTDLGGPGFPNSKVLGGYDFVNEDENPWDDNGHGTHCAGIAAAHGTVTGVAPDAKITSAKVLDSGGNGVLSDVDAGIDWCRNNSLMYNISVISMSIGTKTWHTCDISTCESTFDSTTDMINAAVGEGIMVVVASGNEWSSVDISAPACIGNSTSIGSVDKSDGIAGSSNSCTMLDLLAPGVNIYSTYRPDPDSYTTMSGTSMATPHVAGAVAVLQQWSRDRTGQALTPQQILTLLQNSGKIINDARNGLNFSRIDVYKAMMNISNTAPKLSNLTVSPASGVVGSAFYFNVTYTDSENNTAEYVNITIDNATYPMVELNSSDKNTMDGKLYYFNKTLNTAGIHSFNVTASDGLLLNFSSTLNQPAVTPPQCDVAIYSPNVVSWIDDVGASFNFTSSFNSSCNLSAAYVNFTLGNGSYAMSAADSSDATTSDGKKFYRELVINTGGLMKTYFSAADVEGNNATQLSYIGPAVKTNASCTGSSPPSTDFWSILLNTNCSNSHFMASSTGGLNVTSGKTLRLSSATLFMNNSLLRFEENSSLILEESELAFIT